MVTFHGLMRSVADSAELDGSFDRKQTSVLANVVMPHLNQARSGDEG